MFLDKINKGMDQLATLWNKLPSEIKVAMYIAVSYGLTELITRLSAVTTDKEILVVGINIALVFMKELRARIPLVKSAVKNLFE